MAKKKKVRVDLKKNREKPSRNRSWTRKFNTEQFDEDSTVDHENVRAKGALSRKRTVVQDDTDGESDQSTVGMPSIDTSECLKGRVLRLHGLASVVETEDGREFRCAVRRRLKNLSTDARNVVAVGDQVWIRPSLNDEGFIERVEPRHGMLTRSSRKKEHVIVANVDQVVVVLSLREPDLKPYLIDRYLASAEQGGITPILCLNKCDLVEMDEYQPFVGFYSQLGITTFLTSASTGRGVDHLRERLKDKQTVFTGQSGVGKSSLLNAIEPGFDLHTREVSDTTQKGRHTTTAAQLLRLQIGGWVVDTPGIRQFQLWDIIPEEMEGFFPEFRPYVPLCAFPDCTHTHEERCAVKEAVKQGRISDRRYTSYIGLYSGKLEEE